eukprot:s558_g28.t1
MFRHVQRAPCIPNSKAAAADHSAAWPSQSVAVWFRRRKLVVSPGATSTGAAKNVVLSIFAPRNPKKSRKNSGKKTKQIQQKISATDHRKFSADHTMKGVSSEATNTDKMRAHQMKVKPTDGLRHEDVDLMVCTDLIDQSQTSVLNGSVSHASVLEVLSANPEDKAMASDADPQMLVKVVFKLFTRSSVVRNHRVSVAGVAGSFTSQHAVGVVTMASLPTLRSLESLRSDETIEGEVVYRMGGQFWPSRCFARLTGDLLLIQRSGKQEAAVTLHGAEVMLRSQSTVR